VPRFRPRFGIVPVVLLAVLVYVTLALYLSRQMVTDDDEAGTSRSGT